MIRRIVAAVIAFSALLFLYALYLAAFRRVWGLKELSPDLLPQPPQVAHWRQLARTTDVAHRVAVETFGEDAWQANAVISLYWADQDIFLYANRYEFPTNKTMVLRPVSVVRRVQRKGEDVEYYVLTAGEAELEFERPISLASFSQVRPVVARAAEDVRIAWNRGTADPADDVLVQVENITYSAKRQLVWCTGRVHITGDQMTLDGEDGRVTLREKDGRLQVESLQLARGIRIDALLGATARGLLGQSEESDGKQPDQAVTLTCDGPLVIKADAPLAVLHKNVRVAVRSASTPPDVLTADELRVRWSVAPQRASTRRRGRQPALLLRSVTASGQPVTIRSPSRRLQATATRFDYDHERRTVELTSDGEVEAHYGRFRLFVRKLQLTFLPDGRFKAAAPGAGRLVARGAEDRGAGTTATWQQEALLDTEGDQQIAILKGNVTVSHGEQGKLTAQQAVRLWFDRTPQPDAETAGSAVPSRIEASGNVRLNSPTLTLTTDLLTATIVQPAPRQPSAGPPPRRRIPLRWVVWRDGPAVRVKGVRPAAADTQPPQQPVAPPDAAPREPGKARPDTDMKPASAPKKHVAINAAHIRVVLELKGRQTRAREVWAQRDVTVVQSDPDAETRITADQVHVRNLERGYFFEVKGEPASIEARGLTIRGDTIGFDQPTQVAWVQGKGQMQFVADVSLAGREAVEQQPIDIHWQEEMFFDGLVAEFTGAVRVQQQATAIQCQRLEVFLSERVALTGSATRQRKVKLAKLVATGAVELASASETNRTVVACPRLVYDQQEGRIAIAGPGKLWLASFGSSMSFGAGEQTENAASWNGTLALFDQLMEVEQKEQSLVRLVGRVRVWHAPVEDAETRFTHEKPPVDAVFIGCDQLELLRAAAAAGMALGGGQIVQFIARGNARLEGRGFYAHADLLKYDATGAEPKVVAEATGSGFATFYRQTVPGRRPDVLRARKVYYWPRTGEFRQEGGIMLDVRGAPAGPPRR